MNSTLSRQKTIDLRAKVQQVFGQGYFVAVETIFNKGRLKQAVAIASSKERWYRLEFEEQYDNEQRVRSFSIAAGCIAEARARGYLHFALDGEGYVKSVSGDT